MVRRATASELQDLETLMDRLQEAATRDSVTLRWKADAEIPEEVRGRVEQGYVTFVPRLGTGRIIDVERKFALDYNIHHLEAVEL